MLQFAVCDDESTQREYLTQLLNRWAADRGIPVRISGFAHAEAFLFAYEDRKDFDMLLLDIQMKEINGVTLAEKVRREDESMQIVFITAFADYMPYGYEVSALHYLMKPVDEQKLFQVLDKAAKNREKRENPILIPTNEGKKKIIPSEILYIEAFRHQISIALKDRKIETQLAIGEMEARLSAAFIRCHRSYLVHLGHITALAKNEAILDNGEAVPISRRLSREVNERYLRYFHPDILEGDMDD